MYRVCVYIITKSVGNLLMLLLSMRQINNDSFNKTNRNKTGN